MNGKKIFILLLLISVISSLEISESAYASVNLTVALIFHGEPVASTYALKGAEVNGDTVAGVPFGCFPKGVTKTFKSSYSKGNQKTAWALTVLSIADVAWTTDDLLLYDGGNKLIGVADKISFDTRNLLNCKVLFKFNNFEIPKIPIMIKLSGGGKARISQNLVKKGYIELDPGPQFFSQQN